MNEEITMQDTKMEEDPAQEMYVNFNERELDEIRKTKRKPKQRWVKDLAF